MDKAPDAFRTISEAAGELEVPQHVLRFWESRFVQIRPMKRGGGRRYYRPDDVDLLRGIRHLLYGEGYTIRGVQRILRDQGIAFVQGVWQVGAAQPARGPADDEDADEAVPAPVLGPKLLARLEPKPEPHLEIRHQSKFEATHAPSVDAKQAPKLDSRQEPRLDHGREPKFDSTLGQRADPGRAVFGAAPSERDHAVERAEPTSTRGEPARTSQPMNAAQPVSAARPALTTEQVRALHSVLDELMQCRRLMEAALAPAD